MIYEPTFFTIEELAPPRYLDIYGEARCWWLLDDRILKAADLLREEFGPLVINDWKAGGNFKQSGLRDIRSDRYSMTSQHAHGRALDLKPKRATPDEVRASIIKDRDRYHMITGIELDVNWVHIDCRNYEGLFQFYPYKQKVGKKDAANKLKVRDLR